MQIPFNPADLTHILPWIVVVMFGVAIPVLDVFAKPETDRSYAGYLALGGLGLAFALNVLQWSSPGAHVFSGMLAVDRFGLFMNAAFLIAAALSILLGMSFFKEHGLNRGEFYGLVLMSLSGMMLMGMANDLLIFFVALEIMSISIYALAAYQRHLNKSIEAALKYFLMGAFSTAFLLFGIAFVYGGTGTTNLTGILEIIKVGIPGQFGLLSLGMIFILIGFAFKVSAVPFHMWTPDAYEGAPTPVTGFMAAAVKAAAFAGFARIFITALFPLKTAAIGWENPLWLMAILTMTLGNLAALVQDNVKRMLAYSSIAHAGYIMLGFIAISQSPENNGAASILFYLLVYAIMNLGAFGVVVLFGRRGDENLDITKGWAGMGMSAPALGVAMTIFLLSLAGIPPTAGFMAKWCIFKAAIDEGFILIVVIAVINSLISVYYYLRVMVYMYMVPAEDGAAPSALKSLPASLAVIASAVLVLWLGILPSGALKAAQAAVASLFGG